MRIFLPSILFLLMLPISSYTFPSDNAVCESSASTEALENIVSAEIYSALNNPITHKSREEIIKSIIISVKSAKTKTTKLSGRTYFCKATVEVSLPSKASEKVKTNHILAILIGESGVYASEKGIETEIIYNAHAQSGKPIQIESPFGQRAIAEAVVAIGAAGGFN